MKFCIREWSEGTIVLMTDSGHVLAYFTSIVEALEACSEWYRSNKGETKYSVSIRCLENKDLENKDDVQRFAAAA